MASASTHSQLWASRQNTDKERVVYVVVVAFVVVVLWMLSLLLQAFQLHYIYVCMFVHMCVLTALKC